MVSTRSGKNASTNPPKRERKRKIQTKGKKPKEEPKEESKEEKHEIEEQNTKKLKPNELKSTEILEKGLIYFFYRPKVGIHEVKGPADVQKLYLLLWPGADSIKRDEKEMTHHLGKMGSNEPERLIIIAKKKLPESHKHERFFAFVDKVSYSVEEIDLPLEAITYTTKTRGERHIEGARPVGEGVYALVRDGNHVHLAYVLELPEEPTEIQEAFNITKEGSLIVMVKNPKDTSTNFLGDKKVANYPETLMKNFIGKTGHTLKFTSATPELLDFSGTELLLIGASDDLKSEFGNVGEYIEELEKIDAKKVTNESLWNELHLSKAEHPSQPLLKGKWI